MKDSRTLGEWAAEETAAERLEQGLPATADDPLALDHLATLLTSAAPSPLSSSGGDGTGAAGSTRRTGVRGSAPTTARADQPTGSPAPAAPPHHTSSDGPSLRQEVRAAASQEGA